MLQIKRQNICHGKTCRPDIYCPVSSGKFSYICNIIKYLILVLITSVLINVSVSAESYDQLFRDDSEKPWHIEADEICYDQKNDRYIATGNVMISNNGRELVADLVHLNHKTMEVLATGDVRMTAGGDTLSGSRMEMNLNSETGTIYNGTVFIKANHFYIRGDEIRKVGENSYELKKASFTTCDGDTPAWKITGKDLKVTIEGYGFVQHAALWTKNMPVLYTPFLVFPVKLKRQTGLLPPQISYSDRKGAEYVQPFFWAINENSDATFYEHYMEKRGNKLGMEYRYVLDSSSKGTLMYDFLDDKKIDDGTFDSSDEWGYEDDNALRPNSDRYWFRMKHDQAMPFGFSAKLDIDIVSDQDYLDEFKSGYTGFTETKNYFNKNFGRDIDDCNDPVRVNRLNLNRTWSTYYNLNAELRWYDNVINRRQNDIDTTLQKLPFIEFYILKKKFLHTPLFFNIESEYTYFYSEDNTKGHRIDAHPRLYLPYKFKNYFSFEPSFGVRQTAWHIDEYEETSTARDETEHREIYDIKMDLSTDIYKLYNADIKNIDRIKHTIRPQIVYDYIPDKDQDKYPYFDSLDRISKKNLITYSITNTLTSRSKIGTGKKDINNRDVTRNYHQICRFKLEQSFDIDESNKENPPDWEETGWEEKKRTRHLSPIYGELEFYINRFLSLSADANWSTYTCDFTDRNVAASIYNTSGDRLFVEHRYTQGSSESIYTELFFNISDSLSIFVEHEQNIYDGKRIESNAGFLYRAQCWSLNFRFSDESNDQSYECMVTLYGLGEIGSE